MKDFLAKQKNKKIMILEGWNIYLKHLKVVSMDLLGSTNHTFIKINNPLIGIKIQGYVRWGHPSSKDLSGSQ